MTTPRGLALLSPLVAALACSSATAVEPEPLPSDQERELRCLLPGTWEHRSNDGVDVQPAARNFYHLEGDGTGHIEPNEGSQQMGMTDRIANFEWDLDGRNLYLERDDGQTDVFRVDEWAGEEMSWFFYANSMDYGVARLAPDRAPDCG